MAGRLTLLEDGVWRALRFAADMVEQREPYLAGGAEKMVRVVRLLGEKINLNEPEIRGLEAAAWLSNLYRLMLPDTIWKNPGRLSTYDWRRVRQTRL